MFENNDRSLRFAYPLLYVATGLATAGVFIWGIVNIVLMNYLNGSVIIICGFSAVMVVFTFVNVLIDLCSDIKLIRNKLYEKDNGETEAKLENKEPINESGIESTQPQTDIVAFAQVEHIRRLEQLFSSGLLTQAEFETLKRKAESEFEVVAGESVDSLSS